MLTQPTIGQPPLDLPKTDIDLGTPERPGKDIRLWSVTTIIGALDKPGLKFWAAECAAEAAIDNEKTWKAMLEESGREAAVKWLRDAMNRPPKFKLSATDHGSVVHDACQRYALSGTKPTLDDITELVSYRAGKHTDTETEAKLAARMIDLFDAWCSRFQPAYEAAELTVYSPRWGYAGTLDAVFTLDDHGEKTRFLVDYKSTKEALDSRGQPRRPYPEVALQEAAYRHAECAAWWRPRRWEEHFRRYYALSVDERASAIPVPDVDAGLVIHLTPAVCEARPVRCDDKMFRYFLNCLECFRWANEDAPDAIGDPLKESH